MSKVFKPCKLAGIKMKNRFVRSATITPLSFDGNFAEGDYEIYKDLAAGEIGLIITGMCYVSVEGKADKSCASICSDGDLAQHMKLTKLIHEKDGKVVCQINHGGAAAPMPNSLSPSGIPSPLNRTTTTSEMTVYDIKRIENDFVQAAIRVKKAGYDGLQLHCAHGYLFSEFLDPTFNKRTDEYGGCAENRFRIVEETIVGIKAAIGDDFPFGIKINCNTLTNDEVYKDEFLYFCKRAKELGVHFAEISGVDFTPLGRSGAHNYYLERAKQAKEVSGLDIMLVGGVRSTEDAEAILDAGLDFAAISRPFICEPDLVLKLKAGETAKCTSCSKCFVLGAKYLTEKRRCIQHEPLQ